MERIYVNGRFLIRPMTGVERYAYKVCKAMKRLGVEFTLICPNSPIQSCYDVSDLSIVFFGYGKSHLWEQLVLPFFFINKRKYLFYSFTGLGSILVRHKIMTIHDLSFLENPLWFSRGYYWWYRIMTPLAVRTSWKILTVSEFSKREILKYYPFVKESQIAVAYGAPDEKFQVKEYENNGKQEIFALAVSSLDPRKNFSRLIDAFKPIKNCKLYIVGSYNHVFMHDGGTLGERDNLHFLGRVSDDELLRLYNQAVCFIFPSLYEGFGLPPIEAMSCGCPVLASDIDVIKEVCVEAALYFDPNHTKSISDAIKNYLENRDMLSRTLQMKGFDNVKRFSWDKTAQSIIQTAQK